jgi:hypothetical protein
MLMIIVNWEKLGGASLVKGGYCYDVMVVDGGGVGGSRCS